MQVLVIDDSRVARRILSRHLEALGFRVTEAVDGRHGLEAVGSLQELTLAVVDWNMPELDGLGFVQAFRANPSRSAVKILMVTSETGMDKVHQALKAGADEYVMKPCTREMLQEKLTLLGLPPP